LVAPLDGLAGGTWLATNDAGVTLCLLNVYGATADPANPGDLAVLAEPIVGARSRGLLVLELADAADPREVAARLSMSDLEVYAPFQLLAVGADGTSLLASWQRGNLEQLANDEVPGLLVSSAYRVDAVRASRAALLERSRSAVADAAALLEVHEQFHTSHEPERGAFSPCMHRDDARTVSYTRVRVASDRAVLDYRAGPPCRSTEHTRLELELQR
jgi:hypothetical protein